MREEGSGWGTHVYLWQIHFDIWQNQYNIVKLNKIKLKKEKKFKKRKNLKDILDCFIYTEETEMLLYIPVTLTKSLF